jgi:hypothetical protein
MPEMEIRLEIDPVTKKKNVKISYTSDEDALPMEHEDDHRALVDKLIEGGIVNAEEVGSVVVERAEESHTAAEEPQTEEVDQRQSVEVDEG